MKNRGVGVNSDVVGIICSPWLSLVEIGLADLPKYGGVDLDSRQPYHSGTR